MSGSGPAHVVELPAALQNKLYVKAESSDRSAGWSGQDKLSVDAMAISYRSSIGPFAQGDLVVSFIDLLKEATVPIVLYRPASSTTDLGLYGSSHVGILGGIVKRTNVEKILQLDLLKTDYFHAQAYPTYLYYNPFTSTRTVEIDVGSKARDLYDAVSDQLLKKNVLGLARISIPPDTARIVVLIPRPPNPAPGLLIAVTLQIVVLVRKPPVPRKPRQSIPRYPAPGPCYSIPTTS